MKLTKNIYLEIIPSILLLSLWIINLFGNKITLYMLVDIMFLNYDKFDSYMLSIWSIQYISIFTLLFFLLFYRRISSLLENISFMGLILSKQNKINFIKRVKKIELFRSLNQVIAIVLAFGSISIFVDYRNVNVQGLIPYIVYLIKYMVIVHYGTVIVINVSICFPNKNVYLITYITYFSCLIIDLTFKGHFITLAGSLSSEITWLSIQLIMLFIVEQVTIRRLLNAKELL